MSNFLVIGGTGTVGKAFVKKALLYPENNVCIFSRSESTQHSIKTELSSYERRLGFYVGDIKDINSIKKCILATNPRWIVVTSALKRIEVCEANPYEAVAVNVTGIDNVCRAATECGKVQSIAYTSTDKAANPVGVYGCTKAISEVLMKRYAQNFPNMNFVITRFANVLGSTGSVIPIFRNLISQKKPIIVRGDMTRFFLTQDQAADTIWKALFFGLGRGKYDSGDILIPKCKSFRIPDLANIMCRRFGEVPIERQPALSYEKNDEVLVSKAALSFVKLVTDEYFVLNLDNKHVTCEEELLSNDPKALLSEEQFEKILIEKGII
jgi:UDP-N-acetylglucosamine 4,6-dehydratase/5-epimerase